MCPGSGFEQASRPSPDCTRAWPGTLHPDKLRSICVIKQDEYLVSMNNRRLWVLKEARERGLLKDNLVEVRMQVRCPPHLLAVRAVPACFII